MCIRDRREGLRLDTRSVSVAFGDRSGDLASWNSLTVRYADGSLFNGWWRKTGSVLRTVVANPSPDLPIPINAAICFPDKQSIDLDKLTEDRKQALPAVR